MTQLSKCCESSMSQTIRGFEFGVPEIECDRCGKLIRSGKDTIIADTTPNSDDWESEIIQNCTDIYYDCTTIRRLDELTDKVTGILECQLHLAELRAAIQELGSRPTELWTDWDRKRIDVLQAELQQQSSSKEEV